MGCFRVRKTGLVELTTGMTLEPAEDISGLLAAWSEGSDEALSTLISVVYPEVRRIARQHLGGRASDHTLQSAALANEAYLKLILTWATPTIRSTRCAMTPIERIQTALRFGVPASKQHPVVLISGHHSLRSFPFWALLGVHCLGFRALVTRPVRIFFGLLPPSEASNVPALLGLCKRQAAQP